MKIFDYTPLLYHSNYGVGGSTFKTLFDYLNRYHIKSCGIVDNNFFGLPEFIKHARTHDIKPIIGARISLCPSPLPHLSLREYHQVAEVPQCEDPRFSSIVNIQYDKSGQSQEITTPATKLGGLVMTKRDCPYLYLFVKNKQGYENLCGILTAYAFGNISMDFIEEKSAGLILLSNSIKLLKKLDTVFAQKYYLLLPYHTTLKQEFPSVAVNEVFYVTKKDKDIYKLMCKIKNHQYEYMHGCPNHLFDNIEFNRVFAGYQQAMSNNKILAESCNFIPENRRWIFPKSEQKLRAIIKPIFLKKRLTPIEKKRLEYEHKVIEVMGFSPYFCLVYHLKEFALSKGIGMNVRGSAASSFILYVLGLSIVNPLTYSLPFERFLNPQRSEPPDIDVDVEFNQREQLIREIYQEFGKEYVAHISAINRFQYKARFRDTARAFGISPQELKKIRTHQGERLVQDIYRAAEKIDDYPHYFSCHASGIVITPQPVSKYVPLYPSPAGQITNFDKDGIGMVGLVKIDILGVRGFPQLFLSREKIDFSDQNVYTFMGTGKTLGCFQIESPLVRQFLKKIKPTTIMGIANAIAVIRPGPARGGMKEKFQKRLKQEEQVEYPHPKLKKALEQTLGIPIYQEQILQIAHDFAGFSLSNGDMLRRAMTKDRNPVRMKELEELFFQKAAKTGYDKKDIEKVWMRIRSFSSFGFNKAHSTTYATLAYLSAYQKFYNPLEFFCRRINSEGGYYPTYAYLNEARRWGVRILPPDVNKSENNFAIQNGSLITGLNKVRNLSHTTIKRIIKHRPFRDGEDFFYRTRPSIDEGLSLIKSGALDTFNQTWPELYFVLLVSRIFKRDAVKLHEKIPQFRDFCSEIKLCDQLHTINFLPGHHILEIFCPARQDRICDLVVGKPGKVTGTPITWRTVFTKNKKLMSFVTIDDETGIIETIIFPDKYKPHSTGPIMEIQGTIRDDSLIVNKYDSQLVQEVSKYY
ncbi:MAG: PHP domain-containing protein [bacterium]